MRYIVKKTVKSLLDDIIFKGETLVVEKDDKEMPHITFLRLETKKLHKIDRRNVKSKLKKVYDDVT